MAKKAAQPQLSPKREEAIAKAKRVEDGLLTAQATVPKLAREAGELREMLEGGKADEEAS